MDKKWLISGLTAALFFSGASLAISKNRNGDKTAGDKVRDVLPPVQPMLPHQDIVLITDWYRQGKGLPPGLAKKHPWPPGIAQQIRKGGLLPPGLRRHVEPLPLAIDKRLCILPAGYRRVVIAGNIVIMNEKTALIYDVMRLAIP